MTTLNYVTVGEVLDLTPTDMNLPEGKLLRLISHASRLIRHHTRGATYAVDADGLPTNEPVVEALREATAMQVVAWCETDMVNDVLTGGVTMEARVSSSSINGASVTLDSSMSERARQRLLDGGLGAEAMIILEDAGLLGGLPVVRR